VNGAEALVRTAAEAGVGVCFANPGTTEMPLVRALDAAGGIRPVLGLFEGVCTGAADGYGRMTGRPALTLLHLGSGLSNGLANLHNARRARTPIVNVVGDHAVSHLPLDPPLASDIAGIAAPVSGWVRTSTSAEAVAGDTAAAIAAAGAGRVATLIVPADCQWGVAPGPVEVPTAPSPATVESTRITEIASLLRERSAGVLLLGGSGLSAAGTRAAVAAASAAGWRVLAETFPARMERGAGTPPVPRLPYFPEQVMEALTGAAALVLAGATPPVAFFAYPGQPGRLVPDDVGVHVLAEPGEDAAEALAHLASALDADGAPPAPSRPGPPAGDLDLGTVGLAVAAAQPEGAIVVDESITSGLAYFDAAAGAPPHSYLALTGGAIGFGLPAAVGAAIACPDRPVLAFQADGSAMYTLQSLWTMARESLDVTVVLCANRSYKILEFELLRAGATEFGPAARGLTDIGSPAPDWVRLAEGFGVPATRVDRAEDLTAAITQQAGEPGPALIEAIVS
jgi:acetolactate synthase I/II/III large subunit